MSKEKGTEDLTAHDIAVEDIQVFAHLPIQLKWSEDYTKWLLENGWFRFAPPTNDKKRPKYSSHQQAYFHEFAGLPIFGDRNGRDAEFLELRRELQGERSEHNYYEVPISLVRTSVGKDNGPLNYGVTKYFGHLRSVELRVPNSRTSFLDLAILTVRLSIQSRIEIPEVYSREGFDDAVQADTPNDQRRELTLADAQLALESLRRTHARFWKKQYDDKGDTIADSDIPGDGLSHVRVEAPCNLSSGRRTTQFAAGTRLANKGISVHDNVFPWINALLDPLKIDSESRVSTFGDDRAYLCSLINIKPRKNESNAEVVARITEADLYRIAEVDEPAPSDAPAGTYAYSPKHFDGLKSGMFYNRQMPDEKTDEKRTTRFLFSEHHFAMITCNFKDLKNHQDLYYRHMQFMCIFELSALLQFSSRLSKAVRNGVESPEFAKTLQKIRQDFLTFTHVHHFTNVSHQIQPKEMFRYLTDNIGNHRMYEEVEAEIRAAADFSIARSGLDLAEKADNIQRLVTIGVPASLAVGFAGMNVVVGQGAPELGWLTCAGETSEFLKELRYFLAVCALVFGTFGLAEAAFFQRKEKTGGFLGRFMNTSIAVALLSGILWWILADPDCEIGKSPLESGNAMEIKENS